MYRALEQPCPHGPGQSGCRPREPQGRAGLLWGEAAEPGPQMVW